MPISPLAGGLTPLQSLGTPAWTQAFAMICAAGFLGALAVVIVINQYRRPDMDAENAADILAQLRTFGGSSASVVIREPEKVSDPDVVENIRALFRGERPDEPTTRSAVMEIGHEVREELRARKPEAPSVPVRALQEAVLTAVFGAIAVVPLAAWRNAVQSDGSGGWIPSLDAFLGALGDITGVGVDVFVSFPYLDTLYALALTAGILTTETVWQLWLLPPLVLATFAASYFYLNHRVETELDPSGPSVSAWTKRVLTLAAVTWFTGVALAAAGGVLPGGVPVALALAVVSVVAFAYLSGRVVRTGTVTAVLMALDDKFIGLALALSALGTVTAVAVAVFGDGSAKMFALAAVAFTVGTFGAFVYLSMASEGALVAAIPTPHGVNWKHALAIGGVTVALGHDALALLAAATIAAFVATYWIRGTLARWKRSAELHGRDALALDIVHSLTLTAAALTLPLLAGYVITAVGTGKALGVIQIILEAGGQTALAVGFLAFSVALAAAVVFMDRFHGVRRGFRRALSVQSVRSVIFARTLPFALIFVVAVILLAAGLNVVMVVALALTAGIVARTVYFALNYARYRAQSRESGDRTAGRVVVNGRTVTDSDGEPVYVAGVNGHRTAHRELDQLIAQIQRDTRSLLREGHPESGSFARYFYVNGVQRGKVDIDSVTNELLGDIRSRFEVNVKDTDADAPTIMDKLRSEYPDRAVEKVVQNLKDRGRVMRREDAFVWMGD